MKPILIVFVSIITLTACNKKSSDKTTTDEQISDTTNISTTPADSADIKITVDGDPVIDQTKKETPPPAPKVIEDDMQTGVIYKKADAYVIRETLPGGANVDYYAENLGEEFKKEGLRVKFKGTLLEIPSNVRMIGKPIKLTKIVKA